MWPLLTKKKKLLQADSAPWKRTTNRMCLHFIFVQSTCTMWNFPRTPGLVTDCLFPDNLLHLLCCKNRIKINLLGNWRFYEFSPCFDLFKANESVANQLLSSVNSVDRGLTLLTKQKAYLRDFSFTLKIFSVLSHESHFATKPICSSHREVSILHSVSL